MSGLGSVGVTEKQAPSSLQLLSCDALGARLQVPAGPVQVRLFTPEGRLVEQRISASLGGDLQLVWGHPLRNGLYLMQVRSAAGVQLFRNAVVR
jgi:hypothetical protein